MWAASLSCCFSGLPDFFSKSDVFPSAVNIKHDGQNTEGQLGLIQSSAFCSGSESGEQMCAGSRVTGIRGRDSSKAPLPVLDNVPPQPRINRQQLEEKTSLTVTMTGKDSI